MPSCEVEVSTGWARRALGFDWSATAPSGLLAPNRALLRISGSQRPPKCHWGVPAGTRATTTSLGPIPQSMTELRWRLSRLLAVDPTTICGGSHAGSLRARQVKDVAK